MKISKLKAALSLLTGGFAGIIKYGLNVFNEQVLGHEVELQGDPGGGVA